MHAHMLGLIASKRKVIAAQAIFNGVAQRRPSDHLHLRAVTEAHLKKPASKVDVASHRVDFAYGANRELVERNNTM